MHFDKDLVFDFGIGNGGDSEHYLSRGFTVVSVDADNNLCDALKRRYPNLLNSQLHVINCILGSEDYNQSSKKFFRNVDFPHLSSTILSWATRDGGEIEEVMIDVVPLVSLIETFGIPFYLKSDIEGSELNLLRELKALAARPKYISVEDCRFGPQYIESLLEMGYEKFSLIDQSAIDQQNGIEELPSIVGTSGQFGPWLQTKWIKRDEILKEYFNTIRDENGRRIASSGKWYDIHACY
jgi:FkbM family methyltransferase